MRHIAEIRNFGDRGSTQNLEALLFCFYNSGTLFLKMFLPGAEGAQKLTLSRFRGPFGDLFGSFWGHNQKISNNLGPKMLIIIFPTYSDYSRGLPTPFLINFRGFRSILAKNRLKITPKIASSVAL